MSDRSPTFAQAFARVLERAFADVHTAMPGEIVSYDAAQQVADVRPLLRARVRLEDGSFEQLELPVLPAVPIAFAGGGGFRETFPLAAGDGVLLVFAEAELESWQVKGGVQDGTARRFHLADAVAFAGLHPNTKAWKGALQDAATWGSDTGPGLIATATGLELGAREGSRATEPVILGQAYRTSEDAEIDAAVAQLTATSTALTTAIASLTAGITANAVPIVGGLLAAAPLAVVVTQLGVVVAQLAAAIVSLQAFKTSAAATLSPIVKTR